MSSSAAAAAAAALAASASAAVLSSSATTAAPAASPAPAASASSSSSADDKDDKQPSASASASASKPVDADTAAAADADSKHATAASAGGHAVLLAADQERLKAAAVERERELATFVVESGQLERKAQVDRIVTVAFKLNPLDVMDLPMDAGAADVQKKYRDLSLLIHPDKCNPDIRELAQKAFATLSAARAELQDTEKREALNKIVAEARENVRKRREKFTKQQTKTELKAQAIQDKALGIKSVASTATATATGSGSGGSAAGGVNTKDPEFAAEWKAEVKELLVSKEWRKRQLLSQAARSDGLAAAEKETKAKEREQLTKQEEEWEVNRDGRVTNWRQFQKFGKKRNMKMPKLTEIDDDKTYIKRVKLRAPVPQQPVDPNQHDD